MKSLDKKKRFTETYISGKDYKIFKLAGDEYERSARHNSNMGNYRVAALEHRNAAKCYKEAFEKIDNLSLKDDMHTMYLGATLAGKKAHRMAALYKATEKKPFLIRGLLRMIKSEQILGLFIFSILFSSPSITGGVIGSIRTSSLLGILFFFGALLFSYGLIWRNFLIDRYIDKY